VQTALTAVEDWQIWLHHCGISDHRGLSEDSEMAGCGGTHL
jgi:hypothetical protein